MRGAGRAWGLSRLNVRMSWTYLKELNATVLSEAQRAERYRADIQAAHKRLTPVEDPLARVLATLPDELQVEGLSLAALQV